MAATPESCTLSRLSISTHSSPSCCGATALSSSPSSSSSSCCDDDKRTFDDRLIDMLAPALHRLAAQRPQSSIDAFSSPHPSAPLLPIATYLKRLFKYCNAASSSQDVVAADVMLRPSSAAQALVCTLIYMDRLVQRGHLAAVHSRNLHRLLACGMLVALKMNEDVSLPLSLFAKVSGIPRGELRDMEFDLLVGLGFSATVDGQEFDDRLQMIVSRMVPGKTWKRQRSPPPCTPPSSSAAAARFARW